MNRGEATLVILVVLSALGLGWSILSPSVGRYQIASDSQGLVRMDTKTGEMERVKP